MSLPVNFVKFFTEHLWTIASDNLNKIGIFKWKLQKFFEVSENITSKILVKLALKNFLFGWLFGHFLKSSINNTERRQ